jgi:thiosulfate reductase cytochrome b subunit
MPQHKLGSEASAFTAHSIRQAVQTMVGMHTVAMAVLVTCVLLVVAEAASNLAVPPG